MTTNSKAMSMMHPAHAGNMLGNVTIKEEEDTKPIWATDMYGNGAQPMYHTHSDHPAHLMQIPQHMAYGQPGFPSHFPYGVPPPAMPNFPGYCIHPTGQMFAAPGGYFFPGYPPMGAMPIDKNSNHAGPSRPPSDEAYLDQKPSTSFSGESSPVVNEPSKEAATQVFRSQYRGVSYDKKKRKWRVQIKVAALGKSGVSVGYFDTEEAAARAYDRAAIGLLGKDSCRSILNFPIDDYDNDSVPELVGKSREEVKATLKSERAKVQIPRRRLSNRRRTSRYLGVGSSNRKNQWQARILYHGKVTHLGYYRTEEEAARVYDRVSISLHGENAQTNFPISDYAEEAKARLCGLSREELQRALGVKPMDKSSQYRGVSKKKGKWEAKVMLNRKWAYRELFDTEIEAARAYDAAVWRLKPKEAKSYVNFKDSCPPDVAELLRKLEQDEGAELAMTSQGLPMTAKPLLEAGLLFDEEALAAAKGLPRAASASQLHDSMPAMRASVGGGDAVARASKLRGGISKSASFSVLTTLDSHAYQELAAHNSMPIRGSNHGPGFPRAQSFSHPSGTLEAPSPADSGDTGSQSFSLTGSGSFGTNGTPDQVQSSPPPAAPASAPPTARSQSAAAAAAWSNPGGQHPGGQQMAMGQPITGFPMQRSSSHNSLSSMQSMQAMPQHPCGTVTGWPVGYHPGMSDMDMHKMPHANGQMMGCGGVQAESPPWVSSDSPPYDNARDSRKPLLVRVGSEAHLIPPAPQHFLRHTPSDSNLSTLMTRQALTGGMSRAHSFTLERIDEMQATSGGYGAGHLPIPKMKDELELDPLGSPGFVSMPTHHHRSQPQLSRMAAAPMQPYGMGMMPTVPQMMDPLSAPWSLPGQAALPSSMFDAIMQPSQQQQQQQHNMMVSSGMVPTQQQQQQGRSGGGFQQQQQQQQNGGGGFQQQQQNGGGGFQQQQQQQNDGGAFQQQQQNGGGSGGGFQQQNGGAPSVSSSMGGMDALGLSLMIERSDSPLAQSTMQIGGEALSMGDLDMSFFDVLDDPLPNAMDMLPGLGQPQSPSCSQAMLPLDALLNGDHLSGGLNRIGSGSVLASPSTFQ